MEKQIPELACLLQKVEELTLYIIDLQKQINELKNNNGK